MNSELTLSIVIPVYNEERYIKRCLDSIVKQTMPPLEVIIVDNNCTDKTIKIAEKYDFVKVVRETRQGRGYARTAGFDAARGDIIGRVDADCILSNNWAEVALANFRSPDVAGVTGLGTTNVLVGLWDWYTTFWSRIYFWTVHQIFKALTMWGANMAIRKDFWLKVREKVCFDDKKVHEDQDLSLLILGAGGRIIQDDKLLIKTSGFSYLYWPKFWEYFRRTFATRNYHLSRNTLKTNSPLRSKYSEIWFGALIGWLFTAVFFAFSLLSWPIFTISKKLSNRKLHSR